MAAKPILIGDRCFPTKAAATKVCQAILYKYPLGATVDLDDALFLRDLLALHRQAVSKIGCGVASFQVEDNGPTRGFWVTRTDGTRTDFSFPSCLSPPSRETEALRGFRSEVRDQIVSFRASAFSTTWQVQCVLTGQWVTSDQAHVDHAIPFLDLVVRFLGLVGLDLGAVPVNPTTDGNTETRLLDRELAQSWAEFHRVNAQLRIVSAQANLRRKRV